MEDNLRQRVVGQDHVLNGVSDAVRIARAGLQDPNRPVASFLFMGATGTGKTELAKALASFLYNDEHRGLYVFFCMFALEARCSDYLGKGSPST